MKVKKIEPSPNRKKKYRAYLSDGTTVDFGARGYEQYRDKIGAYSALDHNDPDRRRQYRARHSKILLKDGTPAYKKKYSAAWFSWKYLW